MSRKTDAVVARTIGIDTGKNTLHLIGLYDKGAIILREKLTRGRIAARLAIPIRHFGTDSDQALRHIRENLVVSRRN
jgi:transposase